MELTRANMGTVENVGVTLNYAQPGAHDLSVQVWNPDNTQVIFTAQAMVRIYTAQEIDGLARNVYNRMIDRLTAGNVTSAVFAFNGTARETYRQLFSGYGTDLLSIAESASTLREGKLTQQLAEYIIVQNGADGPNAYFVYLMRGDDGVWRIDSM